jgi:hypothetical protein
MTGDYRQRWHISWCIENAREDAGGWKKRGLKIR